MIDFTNFNIISLPQEIQLGDFDCGDTDYNAYLSDGTARRDEDAGVTRTYLVFDNNKLVGYYSVLMDSIILLSRERKKENIPYISVPALKLGRLATDKTMQRKGLGKYLIALVIGVGKDLSEQVGCRYLTLDALPHRVSYYQSLGFVLNQAVNKEKEKRIKDKDPEAILENLSMRFDLALEPEE